MTKHRGDIQLLESPIPAPAPAALSQKASSDDISGTKRGTIDPLVSKRPEKILNKKIKKKNVKNGQKWSKMVGEKNPFKFLLLTHFAPYMPKIRGLD